MRINVLLVAIFALIFCCCISAKAGAQVRVINFRPFPLLLVLGEEDKIITSAFFRSPSGVQEIPALKNHAYINTSDTRALIDGDSHEDILWKITFQDSENPNIGTHLWIGALSQKSRAWVASTPIARTRWDKIPAKLIVPKGSMLYIAPKTPTYKDVLGYEGEDILSFIYLIQLTVEGISFLPDAAVYEQLIPTVEITLNSEYDPYKRIAYSRILKEFDNISKGYMTTTEVILNFNWKKILTLEW